MKRLCLECKKRPPIYLIRGRVRADKKHTLCRQCYRSLQNRYRTPRAN